MLSDIHFLRDEKIDLMISDIVDIFTNVEGVELVRLSGITQRANNISGKGDIPRQSVDGVIVKLKNAGIIKYKYTTICPHCNEKSYIVVAEDNFKNKPKLCDTCNTFYSLIEGTNISNE
jgi:phage terminase large subunit GpA-like protein